MDIQYLLWLQDFRNSINDAWTPFMEWVSMFATTYLILIPVFWYWNRNKKEGLYTLVSYYFCMLTVPLIKLTACVYRPWIRDPRIIPAGDAITTATGYSFPSGHTGTAGPLAGGTAVICWKKKNTRWISVIMVLFILLTGFSRNYLGVHTPQDVLVALCLSALGLFLTAKLFAWLDKNPDKENWILLGVFIICWIGIAYITLKPYPMDLDANGKLVVDPQKMMNDGYGDIGKVMGFVIARYIEKTWIKFKPLKESWGNILLCLAGLIPLTMLKTYLRPVMRASFGSHWGNLAFSIIYASYYIAFFPLILMLCGKYLERKERASA